MPDLYAAEINGFALEIETTDDTWEKSIARHEYPYKNGALLEDMGLKARCLKFRCYFWDDGADHSTYDDHRDFLDHLDNMEIIELVHPKYGPLRGSIESVAIHHDDRDRMAQIDISFVEGLIEDPDDTAHEDVEASGEEAYNDSIAEQQQEFADDAKTALGSESSGILDKVLDPNLGIVEQFTAVSTKARNYLKTVEKYVGLLEGTLNTIANPANSLTSILNYGNSLPGRVIGSIARCMERYALLYETQQTAPARFADSMSQGHAELAAASGAFAKTTTIAAASHTALQTAYLYKRDETVRTLQKRSEGKPAFDTLGNYTPPELSATDIQPMTVRELESSLATVRGMLQDAINLSRQSTSLKKQALQLQTHVNSIKLEREKITQVQLDNPMPLHLVCLKYGLPYGAADRLMMINDIRNPNEVSGEVSVYVS